MYELWKIRGRENYRGEMTAQWKGGMTTGTCKQCSKEFRFYPSSKKGLFCSRKCSGKYNSDNKLLEAKLNPVWKGDSVSYNVLHKWVKRHKPKPDNCERCGISTTVLDIANKSKEYKRDLKDYMYLCRKCHHKYDWIDVRRDKLGRWVKQNNSPSVIRINKQVILR